MFGVGRCPAIRSQWTFYARNIYAGIYAKGETIYGDTEEGDALQVGGDVILDKTGRVVFNYRSVWPADRVPVKDLIAVLKKDLSK